MTGSAGDPRLSLDVARQALAAQPFSRLLGTRLAAFEPGSATLELPLRDDFRQQHGHLHGGVLCYAADNAVTFAAGSVLGPAVLTGGVTISYLRPAWGRLLRARASVVHAGRRQAVCRCDLLVVAEDPAPDDGTLVAVAQGTVLVSGQPTQA
ncbi:PaaI family thioesterase [Streptomyces sp. B6B3]|uniref:PaaI family thioesterase n=1 Tax=Streptomyces sp. B6B3 TaxID=3153570 RepID=UPI00325E53A4